MILETIDEFVYKTNIKNIPNIIYGAGWAGWVVSRFLKLKGLFIESFAETEQEKNWELEGIPVKRLDEVVGDSRVNIILAVRALNVVKMRKELKNRNIQNYIEVSEILQYKMIQVLLKNDAEKKEAPQMDVQSSKVVGYLSTDYLGAGYAQKRLIINQIKEALYIELPWETAEINFIEDRYRKDILPYRQILEACYRPKRYIPKVNLIHTFNTVCDTDNPWCASFETTIPRVFPETENEKKYYLQLVEYLRRPVCRSLYAFSENAYSIQKCKLSSFISPDDTNVLMSKTKVLHPPQKVLISEDEFKAKHATNKVHFIFIGREFFIKGGREIIQVLSEFESRYPFKLTLISSLTYDEFFTNTSYEEMMRCRQLIYEKEWIDYYPYLPNEAVLEKCKEATVGLLPSVAETYGYAVLEMQAAGCPVVTTNIRAFPETNPIECGWMCHIPVDDFGYCKEKDSTVWSELLSQELRKCFIELFEQREMIKQKGRRALEKIQIMHDPYKYQKELEKNLF